MLPVRLNSCALPHSSVLLSSLSNLSHLERTTWYGDTLSGPALSRSKSADDSVSHYFTSCLMLMSKSMSMLPV